MLVFILYSRRPQNNQRTDESRLGIQLRGLITPDAIWPGLGILGFGPNQLWAGTGRPRWCFMLAGNAFAPGVHLQTLPDRTPSPGQIALGGTNPLRWRSSIPGQRGWIPGASGVTDHLNTSVMFSLTRKITRTNTPKSSHNGVLHCSCPGRPSYHSRRKWI